MDKSKSIDFLRFKIPDDSLQRAIAAGSRLGIGLDMVQSLQFEHPFLRNMRGFVIGRNGAGLRIGQYIYLCDIPRQSSPPNREYSLYPDRFARIFRLKVTRNGPSPSQISYFVTVQSLEIDSSANLDPFKKMDIGSEYEILQGALIFIPR